MAAKNGHRHEKSKGTNRAPAYGAPFPAIPPKLPMWFDYPKTIVDVGRANGAAIQRRRACIVARHSSIRNLCLP